MKTSLSVGERMIALGVLPKEGSVVTLRMIRHLVEKLGLSAEEIKNYRVVEENGGVRWDPTSAPVEFEFADVEADLIRKSLKKMDSDGRLTMSMLSVYEKFVEVQNG